MTLNHIAVSLEKDAASWAEKRRKTSQELFEERNDIVHELIRGQIKLEIPVMTLYLLDAKTPKDVAKTMEMLHILLNELRESKDIVENQFKVSVVGKWYNLPTRIVDACKRLIDETKDFDKYFLNLCIKYDGQQEIVDACRLLARRIQAGKLDPDAIDKEMIKEDIYMSYMAPELIIINGPKKTNGFLLWDSADSLIYFSGKPWPQFRYRDFKKAIQLFDLISTPEQFKIFK